jgi:hypothetical protein
MSDAGGAPEFTRAHVYPTTVKIAGIVWIACGALIFLEAVLIIMVAFAIVSGLFLAALGAKLIQGGLHVVWGLTALNPFRLGIGSIIFGLIVFCLLVFQARDGFVIEAGINLLVAAGLISAGVLALVGWDDYKAL